MDKEELIIQGAIEIFQRDGIKTHTMDEIAKMLKVSKKTLYIYFRNREMLVKRVTEYFLEQEKAAFQEIIKKADNSFEALRCVINQRMKIVDQLNEKIYKEITGKFKNVSAQTDAFEKGYVRTLYADLLTKAQKEGFILPEVKPDLIARIMISAKLELINPEIFPTSMYEFHEVSQTYYHALLKGISTLKGIEHLKNLECSNAQISVA